MQSDEDQDIDREVRAWLDPGGGITIKAVTVEGDPVELSGVQARRLAELLIELADADDG